MTDDGARKPPSNRVASAETTLAADPVIEAMRKREARVEASLLAVDPLSPRHKQVERVLIAARKARRKREKGTR